MELERFRDGDEIAESATQHPYEVLVVDDDPIVSRVMNTMLKAAGLVITAVTSAPTALAELALRKFDVIVSDVDMPGGSGIDLLRAIRAVDLDIPVILVTGVPEVRTAAKALEFGAFRYLTKPIDFAVLANHIRHAGRVHALARLRREAFAVSGHDGQNAADLAGLEVRFANAMSTLWTAYQPIIGARSTALFGVEALMRTEESSMPHPGAVLAAADRLNRLRELGRHTRRVAAAGVSATPGMFLFVNLHPDDLLDDDLLSPDSTLTRIASHVVLEITEREALPSTPGLMTRLTQLREAGYRLAIDDIGAGYSGLTSFADVMPEVVKIDMSLVRGVQDSAVRQRTIRSLCTLCHDSGTLVVGEGVETAEERDCLRELGCDLLQGYMFGRPARDVPRWRSSETLAQITGVPPA